METPANPPAQTPSQRSAEFMRKYLEMAEKGEITSVVVGYIRPNGGAAVQSTPMSAIMLNHLSKLLERRVSREYDRALAQNAEAARSSTGAGAVPEKGRQEAALPRNVRRALENRQKKLTKRAMKKVARKKLAETVIAAPTPAPGAK